MSADLPDVPDDLAERVSRVRIEDEMEQSYIDYAMSVIAGRALPDVRDGLKPVHRRILYSMHEEGITSGSGHRKSSSIVGATMGDFHPHGDSAIYDSLVRMAQDFSMRYPLIDGQGNFGSVDGDPAAAMRYTEARMAPVAEEFLADIEKDTVDFVSNYDDRLSEPNVLPAKVPGLLVNGSSGIAVGMSTNVPPHNLGEIVDATLHVIDNPDCAVRELIDLPGDPGPVEGPDFPTGATIVGREPIVSAYETGRGRVRVRADYEIEEGERGDRIVVTEIPFQANKAGMVETIADLVNEGTIEGITDLRDESDRDGIRVVVELKRGANTDVVENQLVDRVLERTFGVINLALVDGQPRVLTLKETIEHYVQHRKEVVRRRSEFELAEAEERAHILEGRLHALSNIEDVVELIRNSADRDEARAGLRERFDFTEPQAEHIVRMQLGSLTSLEAEEIEAEHEDLLAEIERLETILADEAELMDVIREELREVRDAYADDRRTTIVEDTGTLQREDLIPEEEVLVVVSADDYVKRMPVDTFRAQHRGGKGIIGTDLKEGDRVSTVFQANTHNYLLCFTNQGKVYQFKVYEIPEMGRTARGTSAVNILPLDDGEEITAVVDTDDLGDDEFLTMATRKGNLKRTSCENFKNILSTGIIAVELEEGDELVDVEITDGDQDIFLVTMGGYVIRFAEDEVRATGRDTIGVEAIRFRQDTDHVAGVSAANGDLQQSILTVTRDGYGKRSPIGDYRETSRRKGGFADIKLHNLQDSVATIKVVESDEELVAMTNEGKIMMTTIDEIPLMGRTAPGVNIIDCEESDRLSSVDMVSGIDELEPEEE